MIDRLRGVDQALLEKYNKPGPRYTSYPTAPVWVESFGEIAFREHLARAEGEAGGEPLSLYVHIPFCEDRCAFCGCNVVITKHHESADAYIEALGREMDLVLRDLPTRRRVVQLHLGGGTPTFLRPAQLDALHREIERRFTILPGAEMSIEIDPTVTSVEQIRLLRRLGYNRISMGVQDFDRVVLDSVNRPQTVETTRRIYDACRAEGFQGINFDLIYGLPRQTASGFRRTRELVLEMRPDRLAVYSYAHVPWIKGHQRRIDESTLPPVDEKFRIYLETIADFLGAGYEQIGMDHFAIPGDELAEARRRKALHRNFMGYTTRPTEDMLAFGVSAISYVRGAFAQNGLVLKRYHEAIENGRLSIHRGCRLDADDLLRADVIRSLMCNFEVGFPAFRERHGTTFTEYFAAELDDLRAALDADLYELTLDGLRITPRGRLFVRNICMVFDRYLRQRKDEKPIFSKTI
jgi:oxygen-independent coproporphyrinogen-3 oxidase